MKQKLIRICLYAMIALVPVSCGTRKVDLNKQNLETSNETKGELASDKEAKVNITTQEEAFNQTDKSNETTETTETTRFDKDTGKQTEYSKTTKTGKEIDKGFTRNVRKTITNTHTIEKLKIKNNVRNTVKTIYQTKTVSSDRNGWYYLGGFAVLIAGIIAFIKIPARASNG